MSYPDGVVSPVTNDLNRYLRGRCRRRPQQRRHRAFRDASRHLGWRHHRPRQRRSFRRFRIRRRSCRCNGRETGCCTTPSRATSSPLRDDSRRRRSSGSGIGRQLSVGHVRWQNRCVREESAVGPGIWKTDIASGSQPVRLLADLISFPIVTRDDRHVIFSRARRTAFSRPGSCQSTAANRSGS